MKLNWVEIRNFKAIEATRVPLSAFTVLVGTNGSGKSSVLQALHWMLQSGRNPSVSPEQQNKGSTLSEIDATYMPSPDYKNASHSGEYGNFSAAPKMDVIINATIDGVSPITVPMWIKSARNEGISVHVPSNNPLTAQIRSSGREVSAYIPGLAGIPLAEEKRSKLIVHRQAAAGDANTVLRNILDLASNEKLETGGTALSEVEALASAVLGPLSLRVKFKDEKHYKIHAEFQTGAMRNADIRRFKPLELAGIGFLQVIQIFAYLVYFRPRLLLVDEPDSHLHPDVQERLVSVLMSAAIKYECQVLLSTHSPSVVRSLPADATVVWMKSGDVCEDDSDEIRRAMGWGILDKSLLLITEDKKVGLLNALLRQWPHIQSKVAVWPGRGNSRLPQPETLATLESLFGKKMKILLHRDSDFMLPQDKKLQQFPYQKRGLRVWFTEGCDIEAAWNRVDVIAAHFEVDQNDALDILTAACDLLDQDGARVIFNTKRNEISQFIDDYKNGICSPIGHDEAHAKFKAANFADVYLGKDLASKVRKVASERKLRNCSSFGKFVPEGITLADSLREAIEEVLGA